MKPTLDSLLTNPTHCVSNNLHQAARAVTRIYAEHLRPCGLHRSQFSVLSTIKRHAPIAVSDLAMRLVMDRTTLTRNLKPLEAAGWVRRLTDQEDARVRLVEITKSGDAKFTQALALWRQAQAHVIKLFGESEWRALEATLYRLREVSG